MKHLFPQPSETSPAILGFPFSSKRYTLIHLTLILSWTCYLYAKWRTCADSQSFQIWILAFLELLLAVPDLFAILEFTVLLMSTPRSSHNDLRSITSAIASDATIHVFITTCGEHPEVVLKTVKAAASQKYPEQSYQVFIVDDARNDSLRHAIDQLNQDLRLASPGRSPVMYLARRKSTRSTHYKSGNIRFGLAKTLKSYGSSRYFAVLDADMVPESTWLERTVRPLENDLQLAMAGPPQQFHNVPAGDILGQDTGVFAQILEPLRDRFGCSQCCGSGFVMRREAIESIGGWPLCNVGEDVVCSFALMEAGWRTAHVNEKLQSGVVAGSFHAYVAQRIRWTMGNLLLGKRFRLFLPVSGKVTSGTNTSRWVGFLHTIKPYLHALLPIPMLALPVCLPRSVDRPVKESNNCRWQFLCLWLSSKLWQHTTCSSVGRQNAINMLRNNIWMAPYHTYCVLYSVIFDIEQTPCVVSGTFRAPLNERSAQARRSLIRRMLDPLIALHILYWSVATLLLVRHLYYRLLLAIDGGVAYWYTGAVVRLVEVAFAMFVPVRYMIWPPTMSEAEETLEKSSNESCRADHRYWMRREGSVLAWQDVVEIFVIIAYDWW